MPIDEPFHQGELFVQRRANEAKIAQRNGSMIANAIPKGTLRFIGQQPLAVLGSLDPEGNVWASVLVGEPGFVAAPDEHTVELDVKHRPSAEDDPFWTNIETNTVVGMLVIDLATRRRLRINGRIRRLGDIRCEIEMLDHSVGILTGKRSWGLGHIMSPGRTYNQHPAQS